MSIRPESIPSGFESDLGVPSPNLQYKQNLSRLVPDQGDEPLLLVWYFSLTAGQVRTFFCEGGIPDKWQISTVAVAGVKLNVWNGPQQSGDPIVIGGGGYVRLPALSEYITVQANTGAVQGNAIVWRKYVGIEISTGLS
jgi:hypothetical protein